MVGDGGDGIKVGDRVRILAHYDKQEYGTVANCKETRSLATQCLPFTS